MSSLICFTYQQADALIMWTCEDVDKAIYTLLLQSYQPLLATIMVIVLRSGSKKDSEKSLTRFQANYPILLTSSPLNIYMVYSAFLDSIGRPNNLFKRLGTARTVIRCLMLLMALIWLFLNLFSWLSPGAFVDGQLCQYDDFRSWLYAELEVLLFLLTAPNPIVTGTAFFGLPIISFFICFGHHFPEMKKEYYERVCCAHKLRHKIRFFRFAWWGCFIYFSQLLILNFRVTIHKAHPWILTYLVFCVYLTWSMRVFFGLNSAGSGELSYGQVFQAFLRHRSFRLT